VYSNIIANQAIMMFSLGLLIAAEKTSVANSKVKEKIIFAYRFKCAASISYQLD